MTAVTEPIRHGVGVTPAYSPARLVAGVIGRLWLWLLGIGLLITLLPQLIGWQAYLILTGSMEPGIAPGDIVLVAPDPRLEGIVDRVVSFRDPARPGHVLTHRVVTVDPDGSLITKGDANPTPDPVPVPTDAVVGRPRLLVGGLGLPAVWLRNGDWGRLLALLAVTTAAVAAVLLDQEALNRHLRGKERGSHRSSPPARARTTRSLPLVLAVGLGGALVGPIPTGTAAYTASTQSTGSAWVVQNWLYTTEINALAPYLYWKLDETGTTTVAADSSGNGRNGTYNPNGGAVNFTRLADGALVTDTPDRAVRLGTGACINTTSTTAVAGPQAFSIVIWFRAPSGYGNGGKLIGFERPRTGVAAAPTGIYDRHLYMDGQGRIWFGVRNSGYVAISSAAGLNDDRWHMAVATQSGAGMRLYLDGALVASNSNTAAQAYTGWWRVGCGNLAGWGGLWGGGNSPGTGTSTAQNRVFANSLDEATVYSGTALSAAQVAWLYWAR